MQSRSASFLAVVAITLEGVLASCAPPKPGPQAWIDTPLDNTIAPVAPLRILAHASASGGVSTIEFTIDDQTYRSVTTDGGRLVWREVEWTPPGPGTYRIGARGVGTDGSTGQLATSVVTVADQMAEDEEEEEDEIQVELPPPDELPPGVSSDAAEEPPEPEPVVAAPIVVAKMNANCREGPGTLWDVYANLLEGQRADLKGKLADNTWLLVHPLGQSLDCWISTSIVDVQGDLDHVAIVAAPLPPIAEEPPRDVPAEEEPPEVDVIEPEPIAVDNTPPQFVAIDAAVVACPSRSVRVAAVVGDASGLSSVIAYWSVTQGGSGSGQLALSMGALGYAGTIDPGISEGALQIYFGATDASSSSNYQRSNNILIAIPACIK